MTDLKKGTRVYVVGRDGSRTATTVDRVTKTFAAVDGHKYRLKATQGRRTFDYPHVRYVGVKPALTRISDKDYRIELCDVYDRQVLRSRATRRLRTIEKNLDNLTLGDLHNLNAELAVWAQKATGAECEK